MAGFYFRGSNRNVTLDSRNFLIANWIAFLIKFCRFAESAPWLSLQFAPGSNLVVCVPRTRCASRFSTKILWFRVKRSSSIAPSCLFRYSVYDVEINHGQHVHFHCKKRVYMRRKTRAPSLFAKTAFDPTFIDSLAIDERGGGEGKLESEIQLSKTIFFFFSFMLLSFFFVMP